MIIRMVVSPNRLQVSSWHENFFYKNQIIFKHSYEIRSVCYRSDPLKYCFVQSIFNSFCDLEPIYDNYLFMYFFENTKINLIDNFKVTEIHQNGAIPIGLIK